MESFIPRSEGELKTCVLKRAVWPDPRIPVTENVLTSAQCGSSGHYCHSLEPSLLHSKENTSSGFISAVSPSTIHAYIPSESLTR